MLLGMLLALPRWHHSDAIKRAPEQYLPTILDGPPLGPDEARTIVACTVRARGPHRAPGQPNGPTRASTAPEKTPARDSRARRGDFASGGFARRTDGRAPAREKARPAHEKR